MKIESQQFTGLNLLAGFAVAGLMKHHCASMQTKSHSQEIKVRAALLASEAFDHLAKARAACGLAYLDSDPGKTGLIGFDTSFITSDKGYLDAKRASLNPNYAALIVDWLDQVKARAGDLVAVSLSGSFPALNVCVLSALRAMHLKPMIISSVASSNWGANDPEFCWLDMEKSLFDAKFFPFRSHLVSIGANGDCGRSLSQKGVDWIKTKIEDSGLPFLSCTNTKDSVEQRIAFYHKRAQARPIKAYINVGGGIASVSKREKRLLQPGLNRSLPNAAKPLSDSVMQRFGREKVPLIQLAMVNKLAEHYHLTLPLDGVPASVMTSEIRQKEQRRVSPQLVAAGLIGIAVSCINATRWFCRPKCHGDSHLS